jgi:hypothetical protein
MDGRALMLLKGCESDLICRGLSAHEAAPEQSYGRSSTCQAGWEEEDKSCDRYVVVKKQ